MQTYQAQRFGALGLLGLLTLASLIWTWHLLNQAERFRDRDIAEMTAKKRIIRRPNRRQLRGTKKEKKAALERYKQRLENSTEAIKEVARNELRLIWRNTLTIVFAAGVVPGLSLLILLSNYNWLFDNTIAPVHIWTADSREIASTFELFRFVAFQFLIAVDFDLWELSGGSCDIGGKLFDYQEVKYFVASYRGFLIYGAASGIEFLRRNFFTGLPRLKKAAKELFGKDSDIQELASLSTDELDARLKADGYY